MTDLRKIRENWWYNQGYYEGSTNHKYVEPIKDDAYYTAFYEQGWKDGKADLEGKGK